MTERPEAVFTREETTSGERFVPTELARGPWHEGSQHGSAMSGLLARAVELAPAQAPMQVVRLTLDLCRAAPLGPVEVQVRARHGGKNLELLEAELVASGEVCARAHAARYRVDALEVGDHGPTEPPPPLDEHARVPFPRRGGLAFHDGLALSPVEGFARAAMWVRMLVPLVAGEVPSPLVRLSVAVDWVYAAPSLQAFVQNPARALARPFTAINTDNHLVVTRPPEGEWVCLDAAALHGPVGAGAASARLYDQRGPLGFATQTLLQRGLDKRPKAWR